jgi:uncharacterized membrane protein
MIGLMIARTSLAVVVVCAVFLGLGYGIKATCAGPSQPALYPGVCYTDIQWDRGLYRPGAVPYVNRFVEYPALTGTFMWGTARLADDQAQYLFISALLMAPFALLTAFWLARMTGRRALLWAAAPPLVLFGFLNWDLLVVASVTAALWLWQRRSYTGAGVALGIGAALKLYPLLLLVPLVVDRLHAGDRRGAVRAAVGGLLAAALPNVPYFLASPHGWWATYRFHIQRPPEIATIWLHGIPHLSIHAVNTVSGLLTAASVVAVLAVASLRARRLGGYPFPQTCAALVTVVFLWSKVFSPQYALWLLPFFALLAIDVAWWVAFVLAAAALFAVTFMVGYPGMTPAHSTALYGYVVWARTGLFALLAVVFLRSALAIRPTAPL